MPVVNDPGSDADVDPQQVNRSYINRIHLISVDYMTIDLSPPLGTCQLYDCYTTDEDFLVRIDI